MISFRFLLHVGALAVLAAVLTPITLVLFGFMRRSLQPTSGTVEFLLVLGSFFLAFLGLAVVIALAAPLIALSVGYIQHVKDLGNDRYDRNVSGDTRGVNSSPADINKAT